MLYDPKWEQQAEQKADPFSLASLITWLEKQPTHKTYCFTSTGHCLLARYFESRGFKNPNIGGYGWSADGRDYAELPPHFGDVAAEEPHTFGAALERARSLAARSHD